MLNNLLLTKPGSLSSLEPKIALRVANKEEVLDVQILATNDLEAVQGWLERFIDLLSTKRAYQKEAERLLLWCQFEKGLTLAELKKEHFEEYLEFLQHPPLNWLGSTQDLRAKRYSAKWRPLIAPLKKSSLLFAIRVINSLMNYLVEARYLTANPLKLIKKYRERSIEVEELKYQVWARMLETDEWEAVVDTLQHLEDTTEREKRYKIKVQLLFAL